MVGGSIPSGQAKSSCQQSSEGAEDGAPGRVFSSRLIGQFQKVPTDCAPAPAGNSALVRYLETEGPSTTLAISHLRHATQGSVRLSNTQPFLRELGGRAHVFAHNGDLPGIYRNEALALGLYRPVGQTDSEHAFCVMGKCWWSGRAASLICRAPPPSPTRTSA